MAIITDTDKLLFGGTYVGILSAISYILERKKVIYDKSGSFFLILCKGTFNKCGSNTVYSYIWIICLQNSQVTLQPTGTFHPFNAHRTFYLFNITSPIPIVSGFYIHPDSHWTYSHQRHYCIAGKRKTWLYLSSPVTELIY